MATSYSNLNCADFGDSTRTPSSQPMDVAPKSHTRNRSSSKKETTSTAGQWPYETPRVNKPRSSSHSYQPPALLSLESFNFEENYSFSARLVGDQFAPMSSMESWPLEPNRCTLLTPTSSSSSCSTPHTPTTIFEESERTGKTEGKQGTRDPSEWVGFSSGIPAQSSNDDWIAF